MKSFCELTIRAECGSYNTYNNKLDSIDFKKPIVLEKHSECGDLKNVSVLKDPFITQVAPTKVANVYTTDVAFAHIMAITRSQLSWYVIECECRDDGIGIWRSPRTTKASLYLIVIMYLILIMSTRHLLIFPPKMKIRMIV